MKKTIELELLGFETIFLMRLYRQLANWELIEIDPDDEMDFITNEHRANSTEQKYLTGLFIRELKTSNISRVELVDLIIKYKGINLDYYIKF